MPKKLKERSKVFVIEPFFYTVKVIVSNDVQQSAKKRSLDTEDSWSAMHCGASNRLFSLIFVPHDADAEIIAHECFHCTWHIMKMIGANHENEVMAYTLGYLVQSIIDFVKKKKRVKRSVKRAKRSSPRGNQDTRVTEKKPAGKITSL